MHGLGSKINQKSKGYRLKPKHISDKIKPKYISNELKRILSKMTNWQNSQWLRHANDRRSIDTAQYFLNLVKLST